LNDIAAEWFQLCISIGIKVEARHKLNTFAGTMATLITPGCVDQ